MDYVNTIIIKVTIFLRVLMFDNIIADWPKTQTFVLANSINHTIEH